MEKKEAMKVELEKKEEKKRQDILNKRGELHVPQSEPAPELNNKSIQRLHQT